MNQSIIQYCMRRGDSLVLNINAATADRKPVSLVGCKIWMTAKKNIGDADADAVFQVSTTAGGIVITDAPNGKATVTVPASATVGMTAPARLSYDIQVLTASGIVSTIEAGILEVVLDVTRAIA